MRFQITLTSKLNLSCLLGLSHTLNRPLLLLPLLLLMFRCAVYPQPNHRVETLCRELGSNYLLISRDFKNCMVIRALYFKVFALANR